MVKKIYNVKKCKLYKETRTRQEKKKNRYCLASEGRFITTTPHETHCEDSNNILL